MLLFTVKRRLAEKSFDLKKKKRYTYFKNILLLRNYFLFHIKCNEQWIFLTLENGIVPNLIFWSNIYRQKSNT